MDNGDVEIAQFSRPELVLSLHFLMLQCVVGWCCIGCTKMSQVGLLLRSYYPLPDIVSDYAPRTLKTKADPSKQPSPRWMQLQQFENVVGCVIDVNRINAKSYHPTDEADHVGQAKLSGPEIWLTNLS